jgi:hypothetical protein
MTDMFQAIGVGQRRRNQVSFRLIRHNMCGKFAVKKLAHFPQSANVWPSANGP